MVARRKKASPKKDSLAHLGVPGWLVHVAWSLGIGLFVWLALAPLDEVIRGVGRITPQGRTQVIQHLEGGIVDAILVKEGQVVSKGTPLFRIHDQVARTARDEQSIGVAGMALRRIRLEAEKADGNLSFPAEMEAANPQLAASERQLFEARRTDYRRQLDILNDQQRQKKLQADDASTQVDKLKLELQTAARQLEINRKLNQSGALSESRLLETQGQVQQLETRISQAEGQIPQLKAAFSEIAQRQRQLTDERQSKVADELTTLGVQLQQNEEREKSLGDRLDRTTVVAPTNGVINRLLVTTEGGVVQPGASLAELTPTDGTLLVEGKVSARDRARIWNGQPVTVRVSAYDYASYGSLEGSIQDISADSLKEEQGGVYYRVVIALPQTQALGGKALLPGMTVDFFVKGERKSALWQVTMPLRKLFFY